MSLAYPFEDQWYTVGPRVTAPEPDGTAPRLVEAGDVVFYTSGLAIRIGRVSRKENPRMCRNCWDFYIEGEGDTVLTRNDLWFAVPAKP